MFFTRINRCRECLQALKARIFLGFVLQTLLSNEHAGVHAVEHGWQLETCISCIWNDEIQGNVSSGELRRYSVRSFVWVERSTRDIWCRAANCLARATSKGSADWSLRHTLWPLRREYCCSWALRSRPRMKIWEILMSPQRRTLHLSSKWRLSLDHSLRRGQRTIDREKVSPERRHQGNDGSIADRHGSSTSSTKG